jgi:hypothetical protein
MRIESVYTTSYIIGAGPRGSTEIYRKEVDSQGREQYTVEKYPFVSYSALGQLEAVKALGSNIDKMA